MTLKVYFESPIHAEIVAIFKDDEGYNACVKALRDYAEHQKMVVTETLCEDGLDEEDTDLNPFMKQRQFAPY